ILETSNPRVFLIIVMATSIINCCYAGHRRLIYNDQGCRLCRPARVVGRSGPAGAIQESLSGRRQALLRTCRNPKRSRRYALLRKCCCPFIETSERQCFLGLVTKCVEQRCKLLGLNAPPKVVVEGKLSIEQFREICEEANRIEAAEAERRKLSRLKAVPYL